MKIKISFLALLFLTLFFGNFQTVLSQQRTIITGPAGSSEFGKTVYVLPNGNIVVSDPGFHRQQPSFLSSTGAVYLYNGRTGKLISRVIGSNIGDRVGAGGITVLANGNFIISSPYWGFDQNEDIGAVTLCSPVVGCSGEVSEQNSLVGSSPNDYIGDQVTPLTNGNFVVSSRFFDNNGVEDAGAVTLCDGNTGCIGKVTPANSLVGSNQRDEISSYCEIGCVYGVVPLTNGNFVVSSPHWNEKRGAITFVNGTTGISGEINASNSLVGTTPNELIGVGKLYRLGTIALSNGDYAVTSSNWNSARGAITQCSGTSGCIGNISSLNSLVGENANDAVGSGSVVLLKNNNYVAISEFWRQRLGAVTHIDENSGIVGTLNSSNSLVGNVTLAQIGNGGVTVLDNGNYLVVSSSWDSKGAVTFCKGETGCSGFVNSTNSLVGVVNGDLIGSGGITKLANGNYLVNSPNWRGEFGFKAGAVTWGSKDTGISGGVSANNSLVGSKGDDLVGTHSVGLTNGSYVVGSPSWDSPNIPDVGAITFCGNPTGCVGKVTADNSLIGASERDFAGGRGVTALTNGNYVVATNRWNQDRGAVTFGNGLTGITGVISPSNSLTGSNEDDEVGESGVYPLTNGNYLVSSKMWNGARGALTWGNGNTGVIGTVSPANSLTGSKTGDFIGHDARKGITPLKNGNYVFTSSLWDNGNIHNAGAVTLGQGNRALTGPLTNENSYLGTSINGGSSFRHQYDDVNKQIIIGYYFQNKIILVPDQRVNSNPIFDFDGDGKTDLGIWRPAPGEWWYLRSSDSLTNAFQFGQPSDQIVPADFTGDGATDVAFWRESTGEWFVLRSEDNSFYSFPFGSRGDLPFPGDFDGDGRADPTIFRPASATWYILNTSGGTTIQQFGNAGDMPIPDDFDGDGSDDLAVYRPATAEWFIEKSSDGQVLGFQFGTDGDRPVPADYTGDGKTDIAFWRPASGEWFIIRSEDGSFFAFPFGIQGDLPVPGDYDGDGTADVAVFRSADNTWYIQQSTSGFLATQFGQSADVPIPSAYVP